ncbi:plasmid stabilization system [Rhodothermus marinus SG0.5JP17-172]|jgi:mRNA interferase RelE/StbE|uniref:type II toxin-antitoxin system RelE family toxin n=1 Tax=Rhodothermus marinus TaxID=29549 RepID=UPI000223D7D3|nr:type II toxin-antitoxin system RelE/ParE family toxin [Rhodothermus marinus]AEN73361.1 plasmid stabilization system [Rhodothermus marinus SG0.5JP17-172]MBO2492093.1 type II toxin-antitoxin system RelE/ParE family toxin [Rhodothermus marinus]
MKVAFRKSFERDLRALRTDPRLLARIREIIEAVEAAPTLQSVPGLQKLSGTPNYYRIRVGDYRIGLALEDDMVVFVRCLHRKDIYRYFP